MTRKWRERRLQVLLSLAALAFGAVEAHPTELHTDFTFRRVTPPSSPTQRRITVQIDLVEDQLEDEAPPSGAAAEIDLTALEPLGPVSDNHARQDQSGFWAYLPPESGPDRLAEAARLLQSLGGPDGTRAGLSRASLQQISRRFGSTVTDVTRGKRVSPALALAVIMVESSGRSDAVSPAGAAGLMQLMPATAARFNVHDRFDPAQSIRGGVEYLEWLLDEFQGDAILALAGYNAGENAVKRYGGVPPYSETRAYVPKVVSAWQFASELCASPQRTASDKCVLDAYGERTSDGYGPSTPTGPMRLLLTR